MACWSTTPVLARAGSSGSPNLAVQEQMHRLHVMATVRLSHAALRNMVKQKCRWHHQRCVGGGFLATSRQRELWSHQALDGSFTEGLHLELKEHRVGS